MNRRSIRCQAGCQSCTVESRLQTRSQSSKINLGFVLVDLVHGPSENAPVAAGRYEILKVLQDVHLVATDTRPSSTETAELRGTQTHDQLDQRVIVAVLVAFLFNQVRAKYQHERNISMSENVECKKKMSEMEPCNGVSFLTCAILINFSMTRTRSSIGWVLTTSEATHMHN